MNIIVLRWYTTATFYTVITTNLHNQSGP